MSKYLVRVPAYYYRYTYIEADSEKEAIQDALWGCGDYNEFELEFACIDDSCPDEWLIEEISDEEYLNRS